MASYNTWQGWKVHGQQYLLTDVLKQQLGFDGLVVSDWDGIDEVQGCSKDKCPQAINACSRIGTTCCHSSARSMWRSGCAVPQRTRRSEPGFRRQAVLLVAQARGSNTSKSR
jgi:hypothetical protein